MPFEYMWDSFFYIKGVRVATLKDVKTGKRKFCHQLQIDKMVKMLR